MKSRLLSILVLLSMIASQTYTGQSQLAPATPIHKDISQPITKTINPALTKILWDVDDTFMQKNPLKSACLYAAAVPLATYNLLRHPNTFSSLLKTGGCSEEWQARFKSLSSGKYSPELLFANVIQKISQEKEFMPGMKETLQALHNKGFEMHTLTNMGANDYAYLQTKCPEVFGNNTTKGLFSGATFVTYDAQNKSPKKPDAAYYTNFLQRDINPNKKSYLFIDDKLKNCLAGQQHAGFDYIHVPGNKRNAAVIKEILAQQGIDINI